MAFREIRGFLSELPGLVPGWRFIPNQEPWCRGEAAAPQPCPKERSRGRPHKHLGKWQAHRHTTTDLGNRQHTFNSADDASTGKVSGGRGNTCHKTTNSSRIPFVSRTHEKMRSPIAINDTGLAGNRPPPPPMGVNHQEGWWTLRGVGSVWSLLVHLSTEQFGSKVQPAAAFADFLSGGWLFWRTPSAAGKPTDKTDHMHETRVPSLQRRVNEFPACNFQAAQIE
jgi:hypothetical protein